MLSMFIARQSHYAYPSRTVQIGVEDTHRFL